MMCLNFHESVMLNDLISPDSPENYTVYQQRNPVSFPTFITFNPLLAGVVGKSRLLRWLYCSLVSTLVHRTDVLTSWNTHTHDLEHANIRLQNAEVMVTRSGSSALVIIHAIPTAIRNTCSTSTK